MLDNIDAVIFDMDGTLIDSLWVWRDIDRAYLGSFGIESPPNLQKDIGGKSFDETAEYFIKRFAPLGVTDSMEEMCRTWNEMAKDRYKNRVEMKPGALDFIKRAHNGGLLLGIATSNSRELAQMYLEEKGIRDYFHSIKTGGEVKEGKPAPFIYLEVAKELGVSPDRCLIFEDIVHGIMAGLNAGMKVCAVDDIHSEDQEEEKRKLAHYYIKDFWDKRLII